MSDSVYRPGDHCDKYRIVRLLATGGMGEVYQATQEFIERDVALKVVRAQLSTSDDFHRRLKTEARVLGKIQHPNVVTVYDAGVAPDGVIYVAMQLLEGQTLREALRRVGKVPLPQALQVAATIADGLEAAHEIGVVHRDVKPENVFVLEQNSIKILDLGTAKLLSAGLRTTTADQVLGTLFYMAPEQILRDSVTPRSDIYALGLVLFEMICGAHPFAGVDDAPGSAELGLRQLQASPTPLTATIPGFPPEVWSFIAKAIAKDPSQRHANMAEFAAEARFHRHRLVEECRRVGMAPAHIDLSRRAPPLSVPEQSAVTPQLPVQHTVRIVSPTVTPTATRAAGISASSYLLRWAVAPGAALGLLIAGTVLAFKHSPDGGTPPAREAPAPRAPEALPHRPAPISPKETSKPMPPLNTPPATAALDAGSPARETSVRTERTRVRKSQSSSKHALPGSGI